MRVNASITVLFFVLLVGMVFATIPTVINYQGQLTDPGGDPVADGSYSITFTIYDDPTAGSVLWSSGARNVDVTGGLFTYILGDSVPLFSSLFSGDSSLWLGVQVEADPEISPRSLLTSTPNSAISSGVYGDIKTTRGAMYIDDGLGNDTGIVISSETSALDHHGHVTVLKIANGGSDTTNLVGMYGEQDVSSLVVGDGSSDSGLVITTSTDQKSHHGHVTVLKIANGGSDTTNLVEMSGNDVSSSLVLGDDNSPDSGIVMSSSASRSDFHGHVTVLKIANSGSDTTNLVGMYGDQDVSSVVVGDGSPDSGVVITTSTDRNNHHGHVTVLKIANGGSDTTNLVELSGNDESSNLVLGDGNSPDSGIVLSSSVDFCCLRGHKTVLKISNSGADTTVLYGLEATPLNQSISLGDNSSSDSGIVISSSADQFRHHGHVTVLKIANGGSDTTDLVTLDGTSISPSMYIGDYSPDDSGMVVVSSVDAARHRGHVTVLKMSGGGVDTTEVVSISGDGDQASIQLNGGGGSGGSIYLLADSSTDGGKIGVNNNSPTYEVDVTGTICATGGLCGPSDKRFKKDITPMTNSLALVKALNPVRYNWRINDFPNKNFTDEIQIGFIAQEIKEILPELVSQGSDGYYSLDYAKLTPVLVQAIKEQQSEIKSLEKRLEQLEQMVSSLAKSSESGSAKLGMK